MKCFKGTQMDPLLVSVCPCFRGNAIVTCKIVSFLCSLGYFLLKNVTIFFFGNQISKWRSFEKKRLLLTYFSHFLVTRERTQIFLQHICHLHTFTYFVHPIDFFALPILQKIRILSCMVSLQVTPGIDSFSHHFGVISK